MFKRFNAVRFLLCSVVGVLILNAAAALSKISVAPESVLPVFHQPHTMQPGLVFQLFTLDALTQRVAAAGDCSPYVNPIRSTNTYDVCTQSQDQSSGIYELRIACNANTAHPGYKWHLWVLERNYQIDETRAGCNKHDVYTGSSTCCGRAVAAHCTDANPGAPGGNGCATWNDEGH
jgi:hypothetical protein